MKFKITWSDDKNNCMKELAGTIDFGDLLTDEKMEKIQAVVDKWENKGKTIDQGGDPDWYELDLPDEGSANPKYVKDILADLESIKF